MTITVKELLEHSFVISVDDFRYKTFCERFSKYGLNDPLPRLYKGFTIKNNIYKETGFIKTKNLCNCFFTHIAMVKMAQALMWDYICIFEDDALPCLDIIEKLSYYLTSIPNDVDLMKLGYLGILKTNRKIDQKFIDAKTLGSHSYVVFNRFYQTYIDYSMSDISIDRSSMNVETANILTTNELLFIQHDKDFSDTLHNNSGFFNANKKQGKLANFNL